MFELVFESICAHEAWSVRSHAINDLDLEVLHGLSLETRVMTSSVTADLVPSQAGSDLSSNKSLFLFYCPQWLVCPFTSSMIYFFVMHYCCKSKLGTYAFA